MGYVYFVSYVTWHRGSDHQEFGNEEVILPEPITSIAQIQEMESSIDRRAVILFFQFLREDFEENRKEQEEEAAIPLPAVFQRVSAN